MAQERWWNWLDDDSTFRMNWRDLVIIPYGLYAGFDKSNNTDMRLILEHTKDGKTKVDKQLKTSPAMGIWKSKQGVIITEVEPVILNISTGHPNAPRIDLIVGEHQYVEAEGGQIALYKVIQGRPSAKPVKPDLTEPNKQVELGWVYVPAGATSMTQIEWHKAEKPNAFDDNSVMHSHKEQHIDGLKVFNIQRGNMVITSNNGSTLNFNTDSNFYFLNMPENPPQRYTVIDGISKHFTGAGQLVWCYTTGPIVLRNGGNFYLNTDEVYIEGKSVFGILSVEIEGQLRYVTVSANEVARTRDLNKFQGLVSFNKQFTKIIDGKLDLRTAKGNFIVVEDQNAVLNIITDVASLRQNPNTYTNAEGGTILYVNFTGDKSIITHNSSQHEQDFLPIETVKGENVEINNGGLAMFIQVGTVWALVTVFSKEYTNLIQKRYTIETLDNVTVVDRNNKSIYSRSGNGLDDWNKNRYIPVTTGNPQDHPANNRPFQWEVAGVNDVIEYQRLFMKRLFTPLTTVYDKSAIGELPITVIHDFGTGLGSYSHYEFIFDTLQANPAVLNIEPNLGNNIIFNISNIDYVNTDGNLHDIAIQGIKTNPNYAIGDRITLQFTDYKASFVYDKTEHLSSGYLPIKFNRIKETDTEYYDFITFAKGDILTLTLLNDCWFLTSTSNAAYNMGNKGPDVDYLQGKTGNKLSLTEGGTQLINTDGSKISLKETIKIVSGSDIAYMNWLKPIPDVMKNYNTLASGQFTFFTVLPPRGFTMADYRGGIASINYLEFDGNVNDDDKLFCSVVPDAGFVRIVGGNTEMKGPVRVNYFLVFIK